MTVREDLSYGLSIAGGAVIGAFSWFLNSPLLGVVTGVLLGTGLALLTQSRTQKRAWRRELGLKNIDSIYGPLYREITGNLAKGSPTAKTSFQGLSNSEWQRIRSDYLYDFVPDQLKDLLERHYALIEKYNKLIGRAFLKVGQAIVQRSSTFYGAPLHSVQYGVTLRSGSVSPMMIDNCVVFGEHPREYLTAMYSDLVPVSFAVVLTPSGPTSVATGTLEAPKDLKKFDEFFEAVCKNVKELEVIVETRATLREINLGGQEVQERTLRQIRDPWVNVEPQKSRLLAESYSECLHSSPQARNCRTTPVSLTLLLHHIQLRQRGIPDCFWLYGEDPDQLEFVGLVAHRLAAADYGVQPRLGGAAGASHSEVESFAA